MRRVAFICSFRRRNCCTERIAVNQQCQEIAKRLKVIAHVFFFIIWKALGFKLGVLSPAGLENGKFDTMPKTAAFILNSYVQNVHSPLFTHQFKLRLKGLWNSICQNLICGPVAQKSYNPEFYSLPEVVSFSMLLKLGRRINPCRACLTDRHNDTTRVRSVN